MRENYSQLKKNIEDEIFLIFKKRRGKESKKKKMLESENISLKSTIFKREEDEKEDEEAAALFQTYLFKKKYEVVDELASFQEEVLDENGNNIFNLDRFLSEEAFKKFVQEMNAIKKIKYEDPAIMRILQSDPSNEKEMLEKYDEQFNNLFEEVRRKISKKLLIKNSTKKTTRKKKTNQQISLEDNEKKMEEEKILKNVEDEEISKTLNFSFSVKLDEGERLQIKKWDVKEREEQEKEAHSFEEIKT